MSTVKKIDRLLGEGVKISPYLKSLYKNQYWDLPKPKLDKLAMILADVADEHEAVITLTAKVGGRVYVHLGSIKRPEMSLVNDIKKAIQKTGLKAGKDAFDTKGKEYRIDIEGNYEKKQ